MCGTTDDRESSGGPFLGVLILPFLERVPDRQAAELLKYHLGWKLALNLDLNFKGVHPTTLSVFRERLLTHAKSDLAMRLIGKGCRAKRGVRVSLKFVVFACRLWCRSLLISRWRAHCASISSTAGIT